MTTIRNKLFSCFHHFFHAFPGFSSRPNLIDALIRQVCSKCETFEGIVKKMVQYLSLRHSIMARTLLPPISSSVFSLFLFQVQLSLVEKSCFTCTTVSKFKTSLYGLIRKILLHNILVKHIDSYLNFPIYSLTILLAPFE